jgi:2-C-methyl-D-erythritol 2,4-cyclodiphosphate synthase
LLASAWQNVQQKGWRIANLDVTVIAQAPRLEAHKNAMRKRMAEILGLQEDQVNVKAKTAEKMGPVGRQEAIETQAICLLVKNV